jgi:hypothetical protein
LAWINSSHGKPSGDEGSIKPRHISTTTKAGELPSPVELDSRELNLIVLKKSEIQEVLNAFLLDT